LQGKQEKLHHGREIKKNYTMADLKFGAIKKNYTMAGKSRKITPWLI